MDIEQIQDAIFALPDKDKQAILLTTAGYLCKKGGGPLLVETNVLGGNDTATIRYSWLNVRLKEF